MTNEDLMKERIKVIAGWPDSKWPIGTILTKHSTKKDWFCINDYILIGLREDAILKHPHLFKPLQWWEERYERDMPQYLKVKSTGAVLRVSDLVSMVYQNHLINYLPATETEYNEYLNTKQ
jgi:hypothetical protein